MSTSRWDRPPPPRDWRWVVGTLGKVLIATGLLMFGFVGYQLWGTGIEYRQSQDHLASEFSSLLAGTGPTTSGAPTSETSATSETLATTVTTATSASAPSTTSETSTPETAPPTSAASAVTVPDFAAGDVMALLEIPSIGVETYVVSGVEPADLKHGPGHYPDTPMPGQLGNSAIAGHRTTYGQPFYRLDELQTGDEIVVTTVQGRFVYRVTASEVVNPSESDVVATTDPDLAMLTLTTCTPRYTAAQRLIVFSDLDVEASAAPQAPIVQTVTPPSTSTPSDATTADDGTDNPVVTSSPTASTGTSPAVVGGGPTTTVAVPSGEPTSATADAFAHGWFSDPGAPGQVVLWGLIVTAVSIGAWLLSRRLRRNWVGALVGIVPFLLALYFLFQNVNRLLPAAL